ncbi:MAG: class I SAM-dependent methyltransferase [Flavobacteriales bacterium]|nr:class I SAM-dependent methyltransferase [Flavobacteriales bacterium]
MEDYIQVNRDAWNKRTTAHVDSEFYDNATFKEGRSSLNDIELSLFPDLSGLRVLHLQCHFGQDSISLARKGAQVTAIDLSDEAINQGKALAKEVNVDVEFICCDVYSTLDHVEGQYDLVFTSYGTIGWLPDLNKWANIISQSLKPGGKLVFVEFHPAVWMFDDNIERIAYSYFNRDVIVEELEGSYTDGSEEIRAKYMSWNHGLGEVYQALKANGLNIVDFNEYDYSPYNCFATSHEVNPGKYMLKGNEGKMPMVYSIVALKGVGR